MSVEDLVKGMFFLGNICRRCRGIKFLPNLVLTREFQGGLYHVMWRALLRFCVFVRLFCGS